MREFPGKAKQLAGWQGTFLVAAVFSIVLFFFLCVCVYSALISADSKRSKRETEDYTGKKKRDKDIDKRYVN